MINSKYSNMLHLFAHALVWMSSSGYCHCLVKDPGRLFDLLRPERFREYLVYEADSSVSNPPIWSVEGDVINIFLIQTEHGHQQNTVGCSKRRLSGAKVGHLFHLRHWRRDLATLDLLELLEHGSPTKLTDSHIVLFWVLAEGSGDRLEPKQVCGESECEGHVLSTWLQLLFLYVSMLKSALRTLICQWSMWPLKKRQSVADTPAKPSFLILWKSSSPRRSGFRPCRVLPLTNLWQTFLTFLLHFVPSRAPFPFTRHLLDRQWHQVSLRWRRRNHLW